MTLEVRTSTAAVTVFMKALKRVDLWRGVQASVLQGQRRRFDGKEREPERDTLFFSCVAWTAETLSAEASRARAKRTLSGRSLRSVRRRAVCTMRRETEEEQSPSPDWND